MQSPLPEIALLIHVEKLLQTAYRHYCVSEKRVIRLNGYSFMFDFRFKRITRALIINIFEIPHYIDFPCHFTFIENALRL